MESLLENSKVEEQRIRNEGEVSMAAATQFVHELSMKGPKAAFDMANEIVLKQKSLQSDIVFISSMADKTIHSSHELSRDMKVIEAESRSMVHLEGWIEGLVSEMKQMKLQVQFLDGVLDEVSKENS